MLKGCGIKVKGNDVSNTARTAMFRFMLAERSEVHQLDLAKRLADAVATSQGEVVHIAHNSPVVDEATDGPPESIPLLARPTCAGWETYVERAADTSSTSFDKMVLAEMEAWQEGTAAPPDPCLGQQLDVGESAPRAQPGGAAVVGTSLRPAAADGGPGGPGRAGRAAADSADPPAAGGSADDDDMAAGISAAARAAGNIFASVDARARTPNEYAGCGMLYAVHDATSHIRAGREECALNIGGHESGCARGEFACLSELWHGESGPRPELNSIMKWFAETRARQQLLGVAAKHQLYLYDGPGRPGAVKRP